VLIVAILALAVVFVTQLREDTDVCRRMVSIKSMGAKEGGYE